MYVLPPGDTISSRYGQSDYARQQPIRDISSPMLADEERGEGGTMIWKCPKCGGKAMMLDESDRRIVCWEENCDFYMDVYKVEKEKVSE